MFKKITIIIIGLFLLSGCNGFRDYFKKSANNKYIDTKGFEGSKRRPLYNKKYIALAKRNIIEENFDDEEDDDIDDYMSEVRNPSRENRKIYMDMIRNDARRNKLKRNKIFTSREEADEKNYKYPSLNDAKEKISKNDSNDLKLQQEIAEIKSMLNEAKKDLVKYKCPIQKNIEDTKAHNNLQSQEHIHNESSHKPEKRVHKNPHPI